jgi:hypothetical protein
MPRIKWKARALEAEKKVDSLIQQYSWLFDREADLMAQVDHYKWEALKRLSGVMLQAPLDAQAPSAPHEVL